MSYSSQRQPDSRASWRSRFAVGAGSQLVRRQHRELPAEKVAFRDRPLPAHVRRPRRDRNSRIVRSAAASDFFLRSGSRAPFTQAA